MAEAVDDWKPVTPAAPADDWQPVQAQEEPTGPGFFQSVRDHVEPVMNAFGQGFREGWGPERWGMSEENVKWLSKAGVYAPEGVTSYSNPFQAMNELFGETIARTGEMFSRGAPAAYRAVQSAAVEAGVNRDIASIPDAFMGSPHPLGIPKPLPDLPTRVAEIAKGESVPTVPELAEARSLGVIGPEPPRPADAPPEKAAAAAVRSGDDLLKGPEPGAEPTATGNPWRDRFEHFVGKLNTADDVKDLIRQAATDNNEFQAARAGDVPLAHVEKIAEGAGIAPDLIDTKALGRLAKSDNEMRVAMQMMLQLTDDAVSAARDVKGDASEANLAKLQESIMRRDLAVEQVVARRAEWGRTGNVIQEFQRRMKEENGLSDFLKERGRTPDDLKDIANGLADLDPTSAARVLSNAHQLERPGLFHWTWVQGLISGMLTHTKYVIANGLYTSFENGVTPALASVIGAAKKLAGADVDRVYFGEPMAATWGLIGAVPEAAMATMKSVYSGQRAILKSELELHRQAIERGEKVSPIIDRAVNQISGQGRPEIFGDNSNVWGRLSEGDLKGAARDAAGRVLGAPGDMAMGIHTFFKVLGERAGLGAEAYRAAMKEGLSPSDGDFWRRRSEILENPAPDMLERSVANAYKGTFMNDLGPHGKAVQAVTKKVPGLKWLFPFMHIPINLLKATYEHTPLAVLDADMRDSILGKNGGVAQDKAISRMVAGSAIMGWFVNHALNGRATGDYPEDPKERDSWKLTGKQPNSILIGNTWVSYDKFGPAGNLARLGANIADVIPHLKPGDDEEMTKATWKAAHAAVNMVKDEVGMLSLAMLYEAVQDAKKGERWAATQAGSLIPFSSAVGQTASGGLPFSGGLYGDPYMREVKTFTDGIKNRIPGLRETLLPKRDWLGQPVPNPQYGNILKQREALTDPLSLDMERLQIHPGLPQDRIGGVKLSRPLYDEYQTVAGAYTKTALEGLVNAPGWHDLPPYVQINAIHANIRQSRQSAEAVMQVKHPELIGQGMQQRMDFITGKALTARPKKAPEPATP